jgi:D-alanine-D-alanine ligase
MTDRLPRTLRVLMLTHPSFVPPDSLEGYSEQEIYEWKTDYDVKTTLTELGHEVRVLGVQDELEPIRTAVEEWRPHIVFNLLEEFLGIAEFDQHITAYLELLQVPYTGCNPRGLVLARGKALSKKLVSHDGILVPAFQVFPRDGRVKRERSLGFPLIVKSLTEEASLGISQASVVRSEAQLVKQVRRVHDEIGTDAIAEQFIDGREIYVGLMGNQRLTVFPPREMVFKRVPKGGVAIATERAKHDRKYQIKAGIDQRAVGRLPPGMKQQIIRTTKRIYGILELDGYARVDYRLSKEGRLYFLEANPNPEIAEHEEFTAAAAEAGLDFTGVLMRIIRLGLSRNR